MICSRGAGHERGNPYKYLKRLKLSKAVLYVCHVLSAIEALKSLSVSSVKTAKSLGVVVLVLGLHMEPKPENVATDNEK